MAERGEHQRPMQSLRATVQEKGPSTSQVLAVVTLFPVGGGLLALSGCTLAGTLIGLAVAVPLFLIFSPVLVPAALVVALAVAGFLASGALGLTAVSSLSWLLNFLKAAPHRLPEAAEHARRRAAEAAEQAKVRARETGQALQSKGQEAEKK